MSDAAKPGDTKAAQEEMAKAQADAAKAERARVSGIQSCEEAKGREAMASHLAFNTDMTADAAKAILAAAPKADAAAPKAGEGFQAAMNAGQHPNVGADGAVGTGQGKIAGITMTGMAHAARMRTRLNTMIKLMRLPNTPRITAGIARAPWSASR